MKAREIIPLEDRKAILERLPPFPEERLKELRRIREIIMEISQEERKLAEEAEEPKKTLRKV